jgi:hypothetical protein
MTVFDDLALSNEAPSAGPRQLTPERLNRTVEVLTSGRRFGRTEERQRALRVRVLALKERLEITGGTGNLMVNICRAGTRQSALDRAYWARGGDGQTAPKHPNDRLRHYGIQVRLHPEPGRMPILIGGTARQRACYRRAVARYVA